MLDHLSIRLLPDYLLDDPTDAAGDGSELPGEPGDELPDELPAELPELEPEPPEEHMAGDYPILGKPTIGLAQFGTILQQANSPAAPEYVSIYNASVKYGVDPAVLLAVFQHESSFGKAGIAVGRQNGYGLRWNDSYTAFGGVNRNGWAAFPSWTMGAEAAASLLHTYGTNSIRKGKNTSTVRTFPYVWAPSSDGNKPSAYGAALATSIAKWTGQAGQSWTAPTTTLAAKPAAKPAATPAAVPTAAASGPALTTMGSFLGSPQGGIVVVGGVVALGVLLILMLALTRPPARARTEE